MIREAVGHGRAAERRAEFDRNQYDVKINWNRSPVHQIWGKLGTTSGMGVYPNDSGHRCISDLIWEADTPEPGTTPLKWKLRVPEAPNSSICQ